jgi:hypothetical protein
MAVTLLEASQRLGWAHKVLPSAGACATVTELTPQGRQILDLKSGELDFDTPGM